MDCDSRRRRGTCAIDVLDRIMVALTVDTAMPISTPLRRTISNLIDDFDHVCGRDCLDRPDRLQVFLRQFAAREALILAIEPACHQAPLPAFTPIV